MAKGRTVSSMADVENHNKYSGSSDHDLLIELNVKLDYLKVQFSNHLSHHWRVTIAAISAVLLGLAGLAFNGLMMLIECIAKMNGES